MRSTAAIILAAGRSRRASPDGQVNKLLAPDRDGRRMIARSVAAVLGSSADPVFVVLGHAADAVRAALSDAGLVSGDRLRFLSCGDHADGMAASLRTGIDAVARTDRDAVAICLGDMPLLRPQTLDRMIAAFEAAPSAQALAPVQAGRRGNPVLWRRRLFPGLLALSGDTGGRSLLQRHAAQVLELAVEDAGVLEDFDTPERLRLFATLGGGAH